MNSWHIRCAARVVADGGIIAYPTEAVYGIGCAPWDLLAVARILTLKRRSPSRGLIVVAAAMDQLEPLVDWAATPRRDQILATWPGPVTWILPSTPQVPEWLRGRNDGIAVRVSAHPAVRALCLAAGPLVSTSANPQGYQPARTVGRVRTYFHDLLDYILPGRVGDRPGPTEIRHAASGVVLRAAG